MRESIWSEDAELHKFVKLDGERKTDVLIIGGGLCGILCAYFLQQAGVDYILVEADRIASGITKNTTAKITSQHGLIYDKLMRDYGKEKAYMYLKANNKALKTYKELCKEIECDFEQRDAYMYSLCDRQKIEDEAKAVNSLGFPAEFREQLELPFKTQGAVCFTNQAQFNPLKFIKAIASGLNIYENTFVREIKPNEVITDNGKIIAKKIIVATHFPFINKHGNYFLKLYQHRSYVSAFENTEPLKGMYRDEDANGFSFRDYKKHLIIGGGGHRTGKKGGAWAQINAFAKEYYPTASLKYEWATQDCMSLDGIPYIGNYSKKTPDLYVATGFNKWGMTSSMVAAQILCDMIQEKKNDFKEVFEPDRSILKKQLFINGAEALVNLLTLTIKRCPHMGCALKWNKYEHTWDCPCHGSRFDERGKLIDNPSTKDADV